MNTLLRVHQEFSDHLVVERIKCIDKYSEDLQEIRNCKWGATNAAGMLQGGF
jgi:hypothetical protein